MEQVKQYAFSTVLEGPFETVLSRVQDALNQEGFGILTEIDVRKTLKNKMDVDFRNYKILGACNPGFAHQSLQADLDVGLLLPCNAIVYEKDDGRVHVAVINPISALTVIQNDQLKQVAEQVAEKLRAVVKRL